MSSVVAQADPAYLSAPDYWDTMGGEVADLCDMIGFGPDPEQRLALDLLFAVDKQGQPAAVEECVICARQNLKTGFMKQAALGWLFLTEERLIVWSAHEFSTAVEAHLDLSVLIEGSAFLSSRVKQIYNSAADKSIELVSGARLIFKARTLTGARGLSAPKLFLDEAFALKKAHMGAIIPAQSAMPNAQRVYGSSAGMVDSDILRGIRDRGRAGRSSRQAYLEWCARRVACAKDGCDHQWPLAQGCALDREDLWIEANPSTQRRRANGAGVTLQAIRDERETLPAGEFARERMGWWDEAGSAEIFGPGKWDANAGDTPEGVRLEAIAVAVTVDLKHAAVVGAGKVGLRTYVQPLQHGPGYDWTVDRVADLQQAYRVPVLIDAKGPGGVLLDDLAAAGVRLQEAGPTEMFASFATFFDLVMDEELLHDRDPDLNASLDGAVVQDVGDRKRWGRRKSTSDLSTLEAATMAAWWVAKPDKPKPPPRTPPQTIEQTTTVAEDDVQTMGF